MSLKERGTQALKAQCENVREGAGKSADSLTDWVKEPDSTKESAARVLWIGAAVVMWFMCVKSSPAVTLIVTPVALVGVCLWFALAEKDEPPSRDDGEEPPAHEAGEEPSRRDEFWEKNTPREWSSVGPNSVTASDGSIPDAPTVRTPPKTEEAPSSNENMQVSDLPDTRTAPDIPTGDDSVTGKISTFPTCETYPVTGACPAGQEEVSGSQVSGVSGRLDTGHNQTKDDVTESEIIPEEDESTPEDMVELMLRLSDKGVSVREIALATGRKRSTVQDRLKRARAERARRELVNAAVRAEHVPTRPPGDPVPQTVLPGAWYGEDGHAQEVHFTGDAVVLSGERTREEAVSVMDFIRLAFLGKTEITTGNWSVSLEEGAISGSIPDSGAEFRGYWSETGTVVLDRVSLS